MRGIIKSLERVLGEFERHGDEIEFRCCNCNDKGKHLGINLKKKIFHCFRCGYSGRLTDLFKDVTGAVMPRSIEAHSLYTRERATIDGLLVPRFREIYGNESKCPAIYEYARSRGIRDVEIQRFGLGYSNWLSLQNRLIVPFTDSDGKLIYYIARAVRPDMKPKILNPTGMSAGAVLFNEGHIRKTSIAVLCEGVFDAIRVCRMQRFNERRVVGLAVLGKHLSLIQLLKLRNLSPFHIMVMLDSDVKRDELSKFCIRILRFAPRSRLSVAFCPKDRDPANLTSHQLRGIMSCAVSISDESSLIKLALA